MRITFTWTKKAASKSFPLKTRTQKKRVRFYVIGSNWANRNSIINAKTSKLSFVIYLDSAFKPFRNISTPSKPFYFVRLREQRWKSTPVATEPWLFAPPETMHQSCVSPSVLRAQQALRAKGKLNVCISQSEMMESGIHAFRFPSVAFSLFFRIILILTYRQKAFWRDFCRTAIFVVTFDADITNVSSFWIILYIADSLVLQEP